MGARTVRADAGLSPAGRSFAALAAMFMAPLLILLGAAHTDLLGEATAYPVMFAAWIMGLAGVVISGWPIEARLIVGLIYTVLAFAALPFLTLLAVCTTGNCL